MNQTNFDLWIDEAKNDFSMAEILLNAKKYSGAVFHFIQSLEKSLKAMLYYFDLQPWGHSLINLMIECENHDITFDLDLKDKFKDLEKHYTWSRYPDVSSNAPKKIYNEEEVIVIRNTSKRFIDFTETEIKRRLS